MSTTAKVIVTLVLSAIVVAVVLTRSTPLGFVTQLRIVAFFGAAFAVHSLVGLWRGKISIAQFGVVERDERAGLFWFGVTLYLLLGAVFLGLVTLICRAKGVTLW